MLYLINYTLERGLDSNVFLGSQHDVARRTLPNCGRLMRENFRKLIKKRKDF